VAYEAFDYAGGRDHQRRPVAQSFEVLQQCERFVSFSLNLVS
jgi:hypothetical protein